MSRDLQMRHHHHPLRRGLEVWLPIRAKGWKRRAQNRISQFAIQPSVDEHPQAGGLRSSNAPLLWATSGYDAGQSLQPARCSRPLICPEKTVAYSAAEGSPLMQQGPRQTPVGVQAVDPVRLVLAVWPAVNHGKRRRPREGTAMMSVQRRRQSPSDVDACESSK